MKNIIQFKTIEDYNKFAKHETFHPLVSVLDLSNIEAQKPVSSNYSFYAVFLKEKNCGELLYGRNEYDYDQGSLVFFAPGQTATMKDTGKLYKPAGYALLFHPDLIHGTSLGKNISDYEFFKYQSDEALHLSDEERKTVMDCFSKIKHEITHREDKHSKKLIVSNIEMFLDYCKRFYDRQFQSRQKINEGIIEKFESVLTQYYLSEKPQLLGIATVAYCAEKLNLSPNYFGGLVKRETGITAQEIIQNKTIDIAKEKLLDNNKSVTQISHELGFTYSQHFSRFFKNIVGKTPNKYRTSKN